MNGDYRRVAHCMAALLAAAATTALSACTGPDGDSNTSPTPQRNVLLITLDTTRADRVACYGYPHHVSPHLDRLARRGIQFSRAIAQSAVTNSSHASILTGLNPYRHGVRFLLDPRLAVLDDTAVTFPEIFRDAGGLTAAFVSSVPASSRFGLHQGFAVFEESFEKDDDLGQRSGAVTTDLAVDWLSQVSGRFFCWIHLFDPHDAKILPSGSILNRFKPQSVGDMNVNFRAVYDAEVSFVDRQVGRLLDVLERHGLANETIVAVVADHGEAHGEHDWWGHGIVYQEQVVVPLLLWNPDGPERVRIDQQVRTVDIMPTLLEWTRLGGGNRRSFDEETLTMLWEKPGAETESRTAYCDATNMQTYSHMGSKWTKTDKNYALSNGRWKLIYHQLRPAESELYDLELDPGETSNRFATEEAIREELLANLLDREPMIEEISGLAQPDPEVVRRLKSLGYTQ